MLSLSLCIILCIHGGDQNRSWLRLNLGVLCHSKPLWSQTRLAGATAGVSAERHHGSSPYDAELNRPGM